MRFMDLLAPLARNAAIGVSAYKTGKRQGQADRAAADAAGEKAQRDELTFSSLLDSRAAQADRDRALAEKDRRPAVPKPPKPNGWTYAGHTYDTEEAYRKAVEADEETKGRISAKYRPPRVRGGSSSTSDSKQRTHAISEAEGNAAVWAKNGVPASQISAFVQKQHGLEVGEANRIADEAIRRVSQDKNSSDAAARSRAQAEREGLEVDYGPSAPAAPVSPAAPSKPTPKGKAPDALILQLDKQLKGDVAKIKAELIRQGYDPDLDD